MKQLTAYAPWLCAAALLAVIFGSMYAVVQQAERTGANFPQVQIAEDIAAALNQGAKPETFTAGHVDASASLAPFVIIYDRSGKVIGSSAYLGGSAPVAPLGMLQASRTADYHAVTWQPETNVRIASVTVASNHYYVLSGRNMREVEKNEDLTLWRCVAAGIISWLILGATFVLLHRSKLLTTK